FKEKSQSVFSYTDKKTNRNVLSRIPENLANAIRTLRREPLFIDTSRRNLNMLFAQIRNRNYLSPLIDHMGSMNEYLGSRINFNANLVRNIGNVTAINSQQIHNLLISTGNLSNNLTDANRQIANINTSINALKKEVTSRSAKALKIFNTIGSTMSYIQLAFQILDLAMAFRTTRVPVSYTYNTTGVTLIWDGGWRESRFFGMIPGDSKGIDTSKFMKPIELIRPSRNEGYYYNGHLYPTVDDLRYTQVRDILKGKFNPKDISTVYSFQDITNENNIDKTYVDKDIDKLSNKIFNDLQQWAKDRKNNKNLKPPKFAYEYSYKSTTEMTGEHVPIYDIINNNLKKTIENIKKVIRPIQTAMLPETDKNGYPIDSNELFYLPSPTWNKKTNQKETREKERAYVTVNPNESTYSNLDTDEKVYDELKRQFYKQIEVPWKVVIKDDLNFIDKFSKFKSEPEDITIYEATGPYGEIRRFKDKSDAFNWVWSSYEITAYV
ncbi:MAG: hypothetical protein K2L64_02545, partial [Ureaplasma sp.]|nr:hypothetical protein [Ureaplasma sp.]